MLVNLQLGAGGQTHVPPQQAKWQTDLNEVFASRKGAPYLVATHIAYKLAIDVYEIRQRQFDYPLSVANDKFRHTEKEKSIVQRYEKRAF